MAAATWQFSSRDLCASELSWDGKRHTEVPTRYPFAQQLNLGGVRVRRLLIHFHSDSPELPGSMLGVYAEKVNPLERVSFFLFFCASCGLKFCAQKVFFGGKKWCTHFMVDVHCCHSLLHEEDASACSDMCWLMLFFDTDTDCGLLVLKGSDAVGLPHFGRYLQMETTTKTISECDCIIVIRVRNDDLFGFRITIFW